MNISKDINNILEYLTGLGNALLAYSGGVDSTLLLFLLGKSKIKPCYAVTALSETYVQENMDSMSTNAAGLNIEHITIETDEISISGFAENSKLRCYYCKNGLFTELKKIATEKNISHVLDGSHFDDTMDYRPGLKAAEEIGIISPFKALKWNKDKIRVVSRHLEIPGWDRPSTVCLASRVPYDIAITKDNLSMIRMAEEFLKEFGYNTVRVRSDGITARIEVDSSKIEDIIQNRETIVNKFLLLGYKFVSLDIEGFKSGKMNRVLSETGDRRPETRDHNNG